TDQVIVGNTVANSTREHDLRSTDNTTERILIYGNNLTNANRQNVDPADYPKTTINIRSGHYIYIADNQLNGCVAAFGPGPWTPAYWSAEWIVMDGNRMHNAQIYLAGNVHHAVVRNNWLDEEGTWQIGLRPLDPDYPTRMMSDVSIVNNTGVSNATTGNFLQVLGGSPRGII